MKAKTSLQNLRIFLLAIVTALALWQVSLRVQAQKVEKPGTARPASVSSADKAPVAPVTNKAAAGPNNAEYGAKVKEYTTESYFMTELVDHLPASDKVPSPDKILGYAVGTPNKLTYTKDMYRYYRELEKSTPRVRVFTAPE